MNMKKKGIITVLAFALCAFCATAQTPREIISRMEDELSKHNPDEGLAMTMDIKLPIIGTLSTTTYMLGDKFRMEARPGGFLVRSWDDGVTEWTWTEKDNTVEIKPSSPKSSDSSFDDADISMLSGITEEYDVTLKKEDSQFWYITCKKRKDNHDKDAPKTMDLVVRKSDYFPASLSASMSGVKVTMRDFIFGVSEKDVTFDPSAFQGAKIVDKR